MQQFDSLVSPALVNIQQTELHQAVGDQIVVEPDLLLTKHTGGKQVSSTQKSICPSSPTLSDDSHRFSHTPKVNLELSICKYTSTFTGWQLGVYTGHRSLAHSYWGWFSTAVHLEKTSWKHSSAAWRQPWFLKHSPFRRRIKHLSSTEYSFSAAERESARSDEMRSCFTAAILGVSGVSLYYQAPPIGRALPFPASSSFRQLTRVACWSRWNRSTYTSFPVMNERTLRGHSQSKVCVSV